MPHSERPRFPGPLLIRTRFPDTSSNATLWMKAQHEGTLTPPCIVQKKLQVPNTALHVACHLVNNSRCMRNAMPLHKKRPDFPARTLQGPCGRSQKWRGTLRFLPQFEMRRSSIAPNQVESQEASPKSTVFLTFQRHTEKLPEVTGTSRGNPGILAKTRERS